MSELSESELLLLDNFMYLDDSAKTGKTVGQIVDNLLIAGIPEGSLSGGITVEQAEEILTEIQKNPNLCNMKIVTSIDTDGVRASCFVDSDDNATVAFRGTGGSYIAWKDNILGAYIVDTYCQKMAADFIQNSCGSYDNITVTGHSKGGNMAQYCTVVCGDQIDRCISYDGQGFNSEFLEKYADEIAANQDKISSICCDEDYVNILLTSIAGNTKYLETEEGADAHSSWGLYCNNKDGVDENGVFINEVAQDVHMQDADIVVDLLVDCIGDLPEGIEEGVVDELAALVGVIFAVISKQMSWENFYDFVLTGDMACIKILMELVGSSKVIRLLEAMRQVADSSDETSKTKEEASNEKKLNVVNDISAAGTSDFSVSFSGMNDAVSQLQEIENTLGQLASKLETIKLSDKMAGNMELGAAMKAIREEVRQEQNDVKTSRETLSTCIRYYQETERQCVSAVPSVAIG